MFNITSYLEKFKTLEAPGNSKDDSVLFDAVMAKVENKNHTARQTGVVHISAGAAMKSEIFMRKREILTKVKKITGNTSVKDIR